MTTAIWTKTKKDRQTHAHTLTQNKQSEWNMHNQFVNAMFEIQNWVKPSCYSIHLLRSHSLMTYNLQLGHGPRRSADTIQLLQTALDLLNNLGRAPNTSLVSKSGMSIVMRHHYHLRIPPPLIPIELFHCGRDTDTSATVWAESDAASKDCCVWE